MNTETCYFISLFEGAVFNGQIDLPISGIFPKSNTIKKIILAEKWSEYYEKFEANGQHVDNLSGRKWRNLNGKEPAIIISISPKNGERRPDYMWNAAQDIVYAAMIAMRLDPNASMNRGLDFLISPGDIILRSCMNRDILYSYVQNGITEEVKDNLIKYFLPILDTAASYYAANGVDREKSSKSEPPYQVRNRLMKSFRWFSHALKTPEFDLRFVTLITALEALITNEKPGGSTKLFKERVKYLSAQSNGPLNDDDLSSIYDLRSRLVHGDMATSHKDIANDLIVKVNYTLCAIYKYILSHPSILELFSSNETPEDNLPKIKDYFQTFD